MGSERATGALAIVNHHSYRPRTLLAAFGGDRTGGLAVNYFPPPLVPERSYFIQLCRRAHMSRLRKAATFCLRFVTQLKICWGYPWPQKSAQSAKFHEKNTGC